VRSFVRVRVNYIRVTCGLPLSSEGKGGVKKMLSHTPKDRCSQPVQRGVDRDHPRSDKRGGAAQ
jgi:hypothetical protein